MDKYHQGFIRGYLHSYIGEEAIAAGACSAVRHDDYIVSTHRGHGHCIAKGAELKKMAAELFGKATGYSKGRGGSMHIADRSSGNIGANGIVGAGIPIAAGVGMGIKIDHSDRVVLCFFGDGASNSGLFAESLNMAAIYRLPVIFILENNCYAATTHVSETATREKLSGRGMGYGVDGKTVSGNDPLKVYEAVNAAVENARAGEGPALIEAMTYRYSGHHIHDSGSYMLEEEVTKWKSRDPLDIMKLHLKTAGIDDSAINAIDKDVEREIEDAFSFARISPEPGIKEFLDAISIYDI